MHFYCNLSIFVNYWNDPKKLTKGREKNHKNIRIDEIHKVTRWEFRAAAYHLLIIFKIKIWFLTDCKAEYNSKRNEDNSKRNENNYQLLVWWGKKLVNLVKNSPYNGFIVVQHNKRKICRCSSSDKKQICVICS